MQEITQNIHFFKIPLFPPILVSRSLLRNTRHLKWFQSLWWHKTNFNKSAHASYQVCGFEYFYLLKALPCSWNVALDRIKQFTEIAEGNQYCLVYQDLLSGFYCLLQTKVISCPEPMTIRASLCQLEEGTPNTHFVRIFNQTAKSIMWKLVTNWSWISRCCVHMDCS